MTFNHGSNGYSVCFAWDGKSLAAGCSDLYARIWDVSSGDLKMIFPGRHFTFSHRGAASAIAYASGFDASVLLDRHNFAIDYSLPLPSSHIITWAKLPTQHRNCLSMRQIVLSEYFSCSGGGILDGMI